MIKRLSAWALAAGLLALGAGCHTEQFTDPILGPSYEPKNVSHQSGDWLLGLRRVAVLPLMGNSDLPDVEGGRDALERSLYMELSKAQRFEVVPISREQLKKWTRREEWSASEVLPKDLIETLKKEIGCDAVLFPELTQYRPYPPMVIGWKLHLVDAKTQQILWAVDETLDAGDHTVANAARRYQLQRESANPVLADSRQVLTSPRLFGQFTAGLLLATLPQHGTR